MCHKKVKCSARVIEMRQKKVKCSARVIEMTKKKVKCSVAIKGTKQSKIPCCNVTLTHRGSHIGIASLQIPGNYYMMRGLAQSSRQGTAKPQITQLLVLEVVSTGCSKNKYRICTELAQGISVRVLERANCSICLWRPLSVVVVVRCPLSVTYFFCSSYNLSHSHAIQARDFKFGMQHLQIVQFHNLQSSNGLMI